MLASCIPDVNSPRDRNFDNFSEPSVAPPKNPLLCFTFCAISLGDVFTLLASKLLDLTLFDSWPILVNDGQPVRIAVRPL